MKLHELAKVINPSQDEIVLCLADDNNKKSVYKGLGYVPITFANYEVVEVYGYDAYCRDGIMISIVEE